MHKFLGFIALFTVCLFVSVAMAADEDVINPDEQTSPPQTNEQAFRSDLKYLFEAELFYDYLTPNDIYGSWTSGLASFYAKVLPSMTVFAQVGGLTRKEGEGVLGAVGTYNLWTRWLSTYTALLMGSNSTYLPLFGLYHEFNFMFGPVALTLPGIAYIDYYDEHRDIVLYAGPTLFLGKWSLEYKIYRNQSEPEHVISYSHLISLGYFSDGWFGTSVAVTIGQEAYWGTYLASPREIRENAFDITINHKQWIGLHWGLTGSLSYGKLGDFYERYGISLGFFQEF